LKTAIRATELLLLRAVFKGFCMSLGRKTHGNIGMNRIQLLAFVIASCLAVVFCLCFMGSVDADSGAGIIELESRINPNNAPAAGLMMLPGVGPAKAQAIISYREQFRRDGRGDLAFQDCIDLDNVKGIGPVTVSNMCEHLKFK
jgi:competence ComEA-like helix-hairpin-helix protein